jgi:N-acetylneuraminic acid mutarotase
MPEATSVIAMRAATFVLVLALAGCGTASVAPVSSAEWKFAQSMSQRRSYSATAEARRHIYVAGGMVGNTGRFLALFQRYSPRTETWATLAPLPEPVRAASAAAIAGRLYVTGGQRPSRDGRRVDIYDLRSDAWSRGTPLPEPRFNHATVTLGGKLYILGGFAHAAERRELFVYDPATGVWAEAAPLPRPSHAFAAVAFRGEIWTIGGRRGESTLREVWIFNPRQDRWRVGPALPKPMELLGAAATRDEIHAVWEATYQVYDARTRRWSSGPPPLVHRHALAAVAVEGRLYTLGGCRTPELIDTQAVEVRDISAPRSAARA